MTQYIGIMQQERPISTDEISTGETVYLIISPQEPSLFKRNGSPSHIRQENSISGADERLNISIIQLRKVRLKAMGPHWLIWLSVDAIIVSSYHMNNGQKRKTGSNMVISATTAGKKNFLWGNDYFSR